MVDAEDPDVLYTFSLDEPAKGVCFHMGLGGYLAGGGGAASTWAWVGRVPG